MHHEPALAFVVADGSFARVLIRHGDGHYEPRAQFADPGPNRPHCTSCGQVFALRGATTDKDGARRRFAGRLAEILDDLAGKGVFKRFVLVAPTRMQSLVRERLGAAEDLLAGEVHKDLTRIPEARLLELLDGMVLKVRQ